MLNTADIKSATAIFYTRTRLAGTFPGTVKSRHVWILGRKTQLIRTWHLNIQKLGHGQHHMVQFLEGEKNIEIYFTACEDYRRSN